MSLKYVSETVKSYLPFVTRSKIPKPRLYTMAIQLPFKFAWRHISSFCGMLFQPKLFAKTKNVCLFTGFSRSGHTLVGSLLDAHPEAVIANELDVPLHFSFGFSFRQMFYLMLWNAEKRAHDQNEWTGYSYHVPGQWQGRHRNIRVIGDKKGNSSAVMLGNDKAFRKRFCSASPIPIKMLFVVRNPYDNIASIAQGGNEKRKQASAKDVNDAIKHYHVHAKGNASLLAAQGFDVLVVRSEELIARPQRELKKICVFLGLSTNKKYLDACARIVFSSPKKRRYKVAWTKKQKAAVQKIINDFTFLKDYSWTK